jgi:hypothetical protein
MKNLFKQTLLPGLVLLVFIGGMFFVDFGSHRSSQDIQDSQKIRLEMRDKISKMSTEDYIFEAYPVLEFVAFISNYDYNPTSKFKKVVFSILFMVFTTSYYVALAFFAFTCFVAVGCFLIILRGWVLLPWIAFLYFIGSRV